MVKFVDESADRALLSPRKRQFRAVETRCAEVDANGDGMSVLPLQEPDNPLTSPSLPVKKSPAALVPGPPPTGFSQCFGSRPRGHGVPLRAAALPPQPLPGGGSRGGRRRPLPPLSAGRQGGFA